MNEPGNRDDSLRGVRGWLLLYVIGCFVGAVVNLGFGLTPGNLPALAAFDLLLAAVGVVTGLMLVFSRHRAAVYMARFFGALYLAGALLLALTHRHDELWTLVFRGIMINLLWQTYFIRSKRVQATYRTGGLAGQPGAAETGAARTYPGLFDLRRLGPYYYVGAGFLLASVLGLFTYDLVSLLLERGYRFSLLPAPYYAAALVFALLESAVFLAVSHIVRVEWRMPLWFGLGNSVLGIGHRLIFRLWPIAGLGVASIFSPVSIIMSFLWGTFLMAGLVFAVRLWGRKWWSLAAGAASGLLIWGAGCQVFYLLAGRSTVFHFTSLIVDLLDGAIFGALIAAGLSMHLRGPAAPPAVDAPRDMPAGPASSR